MEGNNMIQEGESTATCQIVIVRVDNGFILHAAGIDGDKLQKRLIANDIKSVRERLHEIAEILYELPEKPNVISRSIPSIGTRG